MITRTLPNRTVVGHHPTPLRLSRRRRYTVYGIGGMLWLSGVLWLVFHYFLQSKGEFGATENPLEPWWLRLHAMMAFAALWTFGLVWGVHVVAGWRTGRHRLSGSITVALLGWLIATGYLLYYLVDDQWRLVMSWAHWLVGLALPLAFVVHRVRGRQRNVARHRHPPVA
jgi:hypothetical protein